MSKEETQEILEEAKSFLSAMITSAKEQKEEGRDVHGMAYLPIRRKAYIDSVTRGMAGTVRFHDKEGNIGQEFEISSEDVVNEVLSENDMDDGAQGTPVFTVPQIEDKEVWNMAISMGITLLQDVKFLCIVTEAWASEQSDTAPSKDPDKSEILLGWCLSFDTKQQIIGLHTHMEGFESKDNKVVWLEPHNKYTDNIDEINSQPQIAEIIERF